MKISGAESGSYQSVSVPLSCGRREYYKTLSVPCPVQGKNLFSYCLVYVLMCPDLLPMSAQKAVSGLPVFRLFYYYLDPSITSTAANILC